LAVYLLSGALVLESRRMAVLAQARDLAVLGGNHLAATNGCIRHRWDRLSRGGPGPGQDARSVVILF
jgi:hypothetical protein